MLAFFIFFYFLWLPPSFSSPVTVDLLVLLYSFTHFYFITNIVFGYRTLQYSFNLCEAVFHGSENEYLEFVWLLQPPYSGSFCIVLPGQLTPLFFPFFPFFLIFCLSLLHRVDGSSCETARLPSLLDIGRFHYNVNASSLDQHTRARTHTCTALPGVIGTVRVYMISVGCRCPVWP